MVAFVKGNDLCLGLLREKSFQSQTSIHLKDQADRRVKFKVRAGIWCLKIDLLDRLQGTGLNQFIYVLSADPNDKGITIPVYELITPILGLNQNASDNWHACHDFIKYSFNETHTSYGQRTVQLNNYAINRQCRARLIQLSGINRED